MVAFITRKLVALLFSVALIGPSSARSATPPALPDAFDPDPQAGSPAPPVRSVKWPAFDPDPRGGVPPTEVWDFKWPTAVGPKFDLSKYPNERKKLIDSESHPNLGVNFEVLAPSTGHPDHPETWLPGVKTYNCIAWSLGICDRWVWPGMSLKEFDDLYAKHGYKRLVTRDTSLKAGIEKIVLYGRHVMVSLEGASGKLREEAIFVATHAARQEADGTWTSKVGGLALIKHPTPEAVCGPTYGDPTAVYVRAKK